MIFPSRVRFKLEIFLVVFLFSHCFAQKTPKINMLFVNEDVNVEASKNVQIALNYIAENPDNRPKFNFSVNLKQVSGNRSEPKEFLKKLCDVYTISVENGEQPHIILDTTMSPVISEIVKSFTSVLALPTISGSFGQVGDIQQWNNIDEVKRRYLLQVMPPSDIIPEVIRSIITYTNMTNAGILFDKTFVMDHKYKKLLEKLPVRHIIAEFSSAEQIAILRKLDITNFFVLGKLESIKMVFETVPADYFERNFAWHVITQDFGNISACCTNFNVTLIRPKSYSILDNSHIQMAMTNTKQNINIASMFYFDLTLRTLLTVKNMLATNKWPLMEYITCNSYSGSNTPQRSLLDLKSSFINNSEPASYGSFSFADDNTAFNGNSTIKFDMDILSVTIQDGVAREKIVGNWTSGFGMPLVIKSNEHLEKPKRIYRVCIALKAPFVMRDESAPRGYSGFDIDLMDEIARMANFNYTIIEADGHGMMNDSGVWNGVVRKLLDRDADIGLGTMQIMAERESVIDFSVPYYDLVGFTVLMAIPKSKNTLFKFLSVLENDVWFCILAAYFFTSFLMYVFDRWSPYSYQNNREKYADDDEKREFTMRECLWFCMTSLTPQGGGEAPKNLSGRLVAATWWLFGFIVIASYTANLAAFLTVSRMEVPIESLEGLSKQFKVLYAPINGSQAMHFFQRMAEIEGRFYEMWKDMSLNDSLSPVERSKLAVWDYPVSDKFTKMWQAMQEAGLPNSLEEAVARIRNESNSQFALVDDATDIHYIEKLSCEFKIVGNQFSQKSYGIAVQRGSPLKGDIDAALLRLLNGRFMEKLKEEWVLKKIKCPKVEDQQDGIAISNIGGVFIVILMGIVLAIFTLIFEYWWFKYRYHPPKIINVAEYVTPRVHSTAQGPSGLFNNQKKYETRFRHNSHSNC
ncbi:ionotropic receptor 25a-like [Contarinia nasturtii]|uniref:ionotropic receptor 25a-like n=1 Tax=Contarinia nasturtii TaxID=265458 RepID=UPI0012D3B0B1|nr:ionotropic receptor 25a-like [Contarinia nasturtii]